jgi:predicted dienelactone hydrolase
MAECSPLPPRRRVVLAGSAAFALWPWRHARASAEALARLEAPGPFKETVADMRWTDPSRQRDLPLRLRLSDAPGSRPLVLFSHGLGGSIEAGRFWAEHWASHGLHTLHLQHPGSDESVWKGAANPAQAMRRAATGTEQFMARVADVKFVLDEMARRQAAGDPTWGRADPARVGLAGHSFGAVTTQTLAGQRFEVPRRMQAEADALRDDRLKAFIAFSPSARTDEAVTQFAGIERPFFSVTGTADGMVGLGLGVPPYRRLLPFEGMPSPDKYLLNLEGADHMIFGGLPRRQSDGADPARDALHVRLVRSTTTAFWLAHLAADALARAALLAAAAYVDKAGVFRSK